MSNTTTGGISLSLKGVGLADSRMSAGVDLQVSAASAADLGFAVQMAAQFVNVLHAASMPPARPTRPVHVMVVPIGLAEADEDPNAKDASTGAPTTPPPSAEASAATAAAPETPTDGDASKAAVPDVVMAS